MSCCDIVLPVGSDRIGHCGLCCLTFASLTAFDAHIRGPEREHIAPVEGERWWLDSKDRWHSGKRGENTFWKDKK